MDRRRRQWVPISVNFAHGKTGSNLLERFGRDGLLVWACFLAACKKNWIQGQFEYSSEPDGWMKLGLYGHEPEFTLDAFFTATGQMKQTRRTRSGRVVDVTCTHWKDWNDDIKRQLEAERNTSKQAGNTDNPQPGYGGNPPTDVEVEVEDEKEVEATHPKTSFTNNQTNQPVCPKCGAHFKGQLSLAEHLYVSHDGPEPTHWLEAEARATVET